MLDWIQMGGSIEVHCGPTLVDPFSAGVPGRMRLGPWGTGGEGGPQEWCLHWTPVVPPPHESSHAYMDQKAESLVFESKLSWLLTTETIELPESSVAFYMTIFWKIFMSIATGLYPPFQWVQVNRTETQLPDCGNRNGRIRSICPTGRSVQVVLPFRTPTPRSSQRAKGQGICFSVFVQSFVVKRMTLGFWCKLFALCTYARTCCRCHCKCTFVFKWLFILNISYCHYSYSHWLRILNTSYSSNLGTSASQKYMSAISTSQKIVSKILKIWIKYRRSLRPTAYLHQWLLHHCSILRA